MKRTALALAVCLAALPLNAQEPAPDTGTAPFEESLRDVLREMIGEMEPALREMAEGMEKFAAGLEPMLREMARLARDFTDYHPPEMLPNGDIIIRKRRPGETAPGPGPGPGPGFEFGPGGEIEI